ncbi:MAG TPA: metallophosphoesterase family protein [Lachnospiraceae bacterium]|nr:metallophosphoesterase family protein [Lachnospiraceae bacterium]
MEFAVISDIHGNYKAFEAFLEYIKGLPLDGIICLGDYVTDSPYPERIMKLLYGMMQKYTCYMVRGNREQYLIDNFYESKKFHPSSATGALYYTALHLSEKDIHFFESLPVSTKLSLSGCPDTMICHGAPDNLRGNLFEDPELKKDILRNLEQEFLFGGHSHNQEVHIQYNKTYLNPGAIGLSIDGVGRQAQFALVHTELKDNKVTYAMELKSIPYDVDSFLQDFTASGLDECGMILNKAIKKTLVTGVNFFYKMIVEVQKITGKPAAQVSESIWQQAADNLQI